MSIISTNHKLIGIQNGGTVSGAVRYDVQQDLTEAEQLQARENIGIKGLGQEYSAGNNIDITDHVISVTGKKLLAIDDATLTAYNSSDALTLGVNQEYIGYVVDGKVEASIGDYAQELRDEMADLESRMPHIYNTGRGGINSYSAIYFTDMYDNLGNGKEVYINRGRPDGTISRVDCGYTVSELGRENAEICSDKVSAPQVNNGNSSNTTKLWYQPYNSDTSQKGFFEGSITFYVNEANRSISVMPLKINGGYDTNSWNPGPDVISLGSYVVGHPITVPFCWKASGIYGIGIKGNSGSTSDSITVNNYYVKYKEK